MLENLGLEIEKDSFVKFLEDFVQQLPLVAEIPVHKTIRYLRDARDIGYRGRLISLFGKSTFSRLQDRVVTILHALRADRWHASSGSIHLSISAQVTMKRSRHVKVKRHIMNIIHFGLVK